MYKFFKKNKKKSIAVKKFQMDENILIPFHQLEQMPEDEIIQIVEERPGAIETIKLKTQNKDLSFRVEMKKGEYWKNHHHDCIETIIVYKGCLLDHTTGKTSDRGRSIIFIPFQDHIVEALEDSIFYVEFKDPKIK